MKDQHVFLLALPVVWVWWATSSYTMGLVHVGRWWFRSEDLCALPPPTLEELPQLQKPGVPSFKELYMRMGVQVTQMAFGWRSK